MCALVPHLEMAGQHRALRPAVYGEAALVLKLREEAHVVEGVVGTHAEIKLRQAGGGESVQGTDRRTSHSSPSRGKYVASSI